MKICTKKFKNNTQAYIVVAFSGLSMSKLDARYQSCKWDHLPTKHSIARAFLSTWVYIFHKAGASDKSSA